MTYISFDVVVRNVDVSLFIVVVGDVGVGVGATAAVIAMARGNDATDGETAADMRVGAVLEGVVGCSTIGAAWSGVIRERESPAQSVVIPGSCRFISTCSGVEDNGLVEGEGGALENLRVSGDVTRRFRDRKQALQIGVDPSSGLSVR